MNWRLRILLPMVLLLPTLTAAQAQSQRRPMGLSAAALAQADNQFGFSLFRSIFAAQSKANVVLSPLSASMALQIAYDGARADTAQGMARVLGIRGGQAEVRAAAHALLASMVTTGGNNGVLRIANSLWARSGVPFRTPFLQHARSTYNARVSSLDFRSASAPATINAWVKHATQGKIPTIVGRIPPDLMLYLINAVYFQGSWARPFNPAATHAHTFTTSAGATQVQMMSEQGIFPYAKTSHAEVITLPYNGGRFSMSVVLPAAGVSLQSLARTLTPGVWRSWTGGTHAAYGSISLPRFSLTTDGQLAAPLARLGMGFGLLAKRGLRRDVRAAVSTLPGAAENLSQRRRTWNHGSGGDVDRRLPHRDATVDLFDGGGSTLLPLNRGCVDRIDPLLWGREYAGVSALHTVRVVRDRLGHGLPNRCEFESSLWCSGAAIYQANWRGDWYARTERGSRDKRFLTLSFRLEGHMCRRTLKRLLSTLVLITAASALAVAPQVARTPTAFANVTTGGTACGVLTGYVAAPTLAAGQIVIGNTAYSIAPGASLSGNPSFLLGTTVCLSSVTANAFGQIIGGTLSTTITNVTNAVNVCGVVTSYTPATILTPGFVVIGNQSFVIAPGVALTSIALVGAGVVCLTGTLNVAGQIASGSFSGVTSPTTNVSICGAFGGFTPATISTPGSIVISGQIVPIAVGVVLGGSTALAANTTLCLSGTANSAGQIILGAVSPTALAPGECVRHGHRVHACHCHDRRIAHHRRSHLWHRARRVAGRCRAVVHHGQPRALPPGNSQRGRADIDRIAGSDPWRNPHRERLRRGNGLDGRDCHCCRQHHGGQQYAGDRRRHHVRGGHATDRRQRSVSLTGRQ